MHMLTRILTTALLLLAVGPAARGQVGFGDAPTVDVQVKASAQQYAPGQRAFLVVVLDHGEDLHSWPSADQDVLAPEIEEFAIRTEIRVSNIPEGVAVGPIQWPEPQISKVPNVTGVGPESVDSMTYRGRALAYIPLMIGRNTPLGEHEITVDVTLQACDESQCYMPQDDRRTVTLNIVAEPTMTAPADPDLAGFDASVFDRGDWLAPSASASTEAGNPTGTTPPTTPETDRPSSSFFGIAIPAGGGIVGLVFLGVLGALGGLILNLTPCVLPVIPIKIMTLSQHAGENRARMLVLGIWMALGVIGFWLGIGLVVALASSVSDPSRVFGIWWLTVGIGVLIAIMSLGLMGMFQLQLPQSLYMVNPKADTPWGSFVFGLFTAILGLPCFGFVAGALVPAALTQGTAFVIVLFTSMGIGMALPYIILAAAPGLVKKLPKTGPASELVKQVMGLLLLAAAAYFIGSGLLALVSNKPYIAKELHLWVAAMFGVAAGIWLILRTFMITPSFTKRTVFSVISIVIAGSGVWLAMLFTTDARTEYEERQRLIAEAGGDSFMLTSVWNDYSPALVDRAVAEGKVVILDFTAAWCINCQALKKAVLDKEPVRSQLRADDTVMVEVDLTGSNPEGEAALDALGRIGIPTLAIFGPGLPREQAWVSGAYTSEQVLDAIERARGNAGVSSAR